MDDYTWVNDMQDVDWDELSELYRIAPLGDKPPEALKTTFGNSMYTRLVYVGDQGKGLGQAIVRQLTDAARGHKKIILYANPGTEGFYARLGFLRMNTAMAIWRDPARGIESGLLSPPDAG